jgi:hypothetical protein
LRTHHQKREEDQTMKFEQFYEAVDNLVREWAPDDPQAGATPRNALEQIYLEVREQAVHDLAVAVSQRDRATRTHGMLIITDRKAKDATKVPDNPAP